jgi:hypothetical protein
LNLVKDLTHRTTLIKLRQKLADFLTTKEYLIGLPAASTATRDHWSVIYKLDDAGRAVSVRPKFRLPDKNKNNAQA